MTYAIGRPAHFRFTGIRSQSGLIHIGAGWNCLDGTRTRCGRSLKNDGDYFHLVDATAQDIQETFVTGTACQPCLRAVERDRENAVRRA